MRAVNLAAKYIRDKNRLLSWLARTGLADRTDQIAAPLDNSLQLVPDLGLAPGADLMRPLYSGRAALRPSQSYFIFSIASVSGHRLSGYAEHARSFCSLREKTIVSVLDDLIFLMLGPDVLEVN